MQEGAFIKQKREAKRLTLDDVAEQLAISKSYLSRLEMGVRPLSVPLLRQLAKLLEFDAKELF